MKTWLVALATLVIGAAAGYGMTWYEFFGVQETFVTHVESTPGGAPDVKIPKVLIEGGLEHNFGTMEAKGTRNHEFVFKNAGNAPLKLEAAGKPTCQCTRFVVPPEPIAPGESAVVLLEWKPVDFTSEFVQSAEVKTNDTSSPLIKLTIRGNVVQFVRNYPSEVALGGISRNESRTFDVKVIGYIVDELKILRHEFGDESTAEFFDVQFQPLSPDELAQEKNARAGIRLTVHVKPGLPLGAVSQAIRLHFEGPEGHMLEIPIDGNVTSDIAVFGSGFDGEQNLLRVGIVSSASGYKGQLRCVVKGPHRKQTKLSLAEVDPAESLRVAISEPTEINEGKTVVYLLTIEIPPGTPTMSRLSGAQSKPAQVLLNTTHPDIEQLKISVSFAVAE